MKKFSFFILLAAMSYTVAAQQYGSSPWHFNPNPPTGKPILKPNSYRDVTGDEHDLKIYLSGITSNAGSPNIIELPSPDGTFRAFNIWQTTVMAKPLADKYPEIHTYTASAVDNHHVTAKIDYTPFGFHAMIADGANSFFVDPFSNTADGNYITYYRRDYPGNTGRSGVCGIDENGATLPGQIPASIGAYSLPSLGLRMNGDVRRTYRLALACTGEYAVAVAGLAPTKELVLAQMVTTLNRVNSVYERDLAITMQLVANNDTLIFLDGSADPYSDANAFGMLTQNQATVDARINSANYDIGHVFGTGGGGSGTGLGVAFHGICQSSVKAQGVTGRPNPTGDAYDIDFVAHEMGHQYGAEHTFNNNFLGDCNGNAFPASAYEPGSGSTIMSYAGICGGDNIQPNSDPYFHSVALEQITTYVALNTCASLSTSGNQNAISPSFTAAYTIPYLTAFELTAPSVTDATADTISYCWEQRDLGDFGKSLAQTRYRGPLFRSFRPSASPTRIFPSIDSLLKSVFISAQEKIPDTTRTLCFRLTERDIYQGFGTFNFPDDSIHLDVVYTGSPFKVLSPNAAVNWPANTTQTVTWNVGKTNLPPINCTTVDIYLSTDGGYTFPTLLLGNTPNDGSADITLPNVNTSNLRIKVKGVNNVFFAISHTAPPTSIERHPIPTPGVNITPVPATRSIEFRFIKAGDSALGRIVNTLGQLIWQGKITDGKEVDVSQWAKGLYYLRLENDTTVQVTRPIIVQ